MTPTSAVAETRAQAGTVDAERVAREILEAWFTDQADLFGPLTPTIPTDVVIDWLVFRIAEVYSDGGTFVDLGGGLNPSNGVLAQMGMNVHVVDLLEVYWPSSVLGTDGSPQIDFLEEKGVNFIRADLIDYDLRGDFAPGSVDSVGAFHVLEHLHHSPRALLESAVDVMKDGGVMLIEVPNAVNILKRVKMAFGRTNYPPYAAYYGADRWTGHVREYSVGDLGDLAALLDVRDARIFGRNWYGTLYSRLGSRRVEALADRALRLRPGFCGALFMRAVK